ncbi:MAG TPA: DUF483 domain-containing protein [Elusimicrobiales bacterium]|nr:DUF483 domain-containing protein [Elusimicrobiales bacterium]
MELKLEHFCGLKSIDIIGLLYGKKKVISIRLEAGRREFLEGAFKKYGLVWETTDRGYDYRNRFITHIISKKSAHIKSTLAAYAAGRYDTVGELLGYPACCVKAYNTMLNSDQDDCDTFVRECRNKSEKFFWPLNNVLDFDGRLIGKKAASLDISCPYISLISHNPCAYDCAESLKIARFNQARLAEHTPSHCREDFRAKLARPVLYVDDFNLAILDGTSRPDGADYATPLYILGFGGIRSQLKAGDGVTLRGSSLEISKQGKILCRRSFPKGPLILPFDRRFPGERL